MGYCSVCQRIATRDSRLEGFTFHRYVFCHTMPVNFLVFVKANSNGVLFRVSTDSYTR